MEHARCWSFFSDPRNLPKITPPTLRFRVRTELPAKIYPGLMIEYTVAPVLGLPIRWLTEIVHVDEPRYFVDEQRIGPYRLWHHEHFFAAVDEQRTEVRDVVHYVPPFGPFGAVLNTALIQPQLRRIFDYRERQLAAFTAGTWRLDSHA
jgi:ligand-binding SRPBCC domain-containing protein